MPKPQAGVPPLVSCPRLLIQYIHSYPLNVEPTQPPIQWVSGALPLGIKRPGR